jgi:hypothetical protein
MDFLFLPKVASNFDKIQQIIDLAGFEKSHPEYPPLKKLYLC